MKKLDSFLSLNNYQANKKIKLTALIISLVVTFIYFGKSLNNQYSIDDTIAFTQNKNANSGLKNLDAIFRTNTFKENNASFGYRPITTLSFAIESELFGVNPFVSHLISLLLYAICCWLFFICCLKVFPDSPVFLSLIMLFVFITLPIHSELVNNIKCRDELLMLASGMLATILWVKRKENRIYALVSLLCLSIAILSKKTGVLFLGIIPLVTYFERGGNLIKVLKSSLLMTAPVLVFFMLRRLAKVDKAFREPRVIENPLNSELIDVNPFILAAESFWFYIKKLFFLTEFVSYYGFNTISYANWSINVILALLVFLLLVFISLKGLKKKTPYSFGTLLFLGCIFPLLNIVIPVVGIVAERFASIASIGMVIFVVDGSHHLLKKGTPTAKWVFYLLLVSYTLYYYIAHQERVSEWKNNFSTLSHDVEKEPNSATLHAMLGVEYLNKIPLQSNDRIKLSLGKKAKNHLEKSTEILPNKIVLTNLGNVVFRVFLNYRQAASYYHQALSMDSTYHEPYYHLGWLKLAEKDTLAGVSYFEKAINRFPKYEEAYQAIVQMEVRRGNYQNAHQWNAIALRNMPENPEFILNEANIFFFEGKKKEALKWFKNSQVYFPHNKNIQSKINYLEKGFARNF